MNWAFLNDLAALLLHYTWVFALPLKNFFWSWLILDQLQQEYPVVRNQLDVASWSDVLNLYVPTWFSKSTQKNASVSLHHFQSPECRSTNHKHDLGPKHISSKLKSFSPNMEKIGWKRDASLTVILVCRYFFNLSQSFWWVYQKILPGESSNTVEAVDALKREEPSRIKVA